MEMNPRLICVVLALASLISYFFLAKLSSMQGTPQLPPTTASSYPTTIEPPEVSNSTATVKQPPSTARFFTEGPVPSSLPPPSSGATTTTTTSSSLKEAGKTDSPLTSTFPSKSKLSNSTLIGESGNEEGKEKDEKRTLRCEDPGSIISFSVNQQQQQQQKAMTKDTISKGKETRTDSTKEGRWLVFTRSWLFTTSLSKLTYEQLASHDIRKGGELVADDKEEQKKTTTTQLTSLSSQSEMSTNVSSLFLRVCQCDDPIIRGYVENGAQERVQCTGTSNGGGGGGWVRNRLNEGKGEGRGGILASSWFPCEWLPNSAAFSTLRASSSSSQTTMLGTASEVIPVIGRGHLLRYAALFVPAAVEDSASLSEEPKEKSETPGDNRPLYLPGCADSLKKRKETEKCRGLQLGVPYFFVNPLACLVSPSSFYMSDLTSSSSENVREKDNSHTKEEVSCSALTAAAATVSINAKSNGINNNNNNNKSSYVEKSEQSSKSGTSSLSSPPSTSSERGTTRRNRILFVGHSHSRYLASMLCSMINGVGCESLSKLDRMLTNIFFTDELRDSLLHNNGLNRNETVIGGDRTDVVDERHSAKVSGNNETQKKSLPFETKNGSSVLLSNEKKVLLSLRPAITWLQANYDLRRKLPLVSSSSFNSDEHNEGDGREGRGSQYYSVPEGSSLSSFLVQTRKTAASITADAVSATQASTKEKENSTKGKNREKEPVVSQMTTLPVTYDDVTDVVVSRGAWDLLFNDPKNTTDLVIELSKGLLALTEQFPRALRIHLQIPHYHHKNRPSAVKGGGARSSRNAAGAAPSARRALARAEWRAKCFAEERVKMMRNVNLCAAEMFFKELEERSKTSSRTSQQQQQQRFRFYPTLRFLDFWEETSTFFAKSYSDELGHHYQDVVLESMLMKFLSTGVCPRKKAAGIAEENLFSSSSSRRQWGKETRKRSVEGENPSLLLHSQTAGNGTASTVAAPPSLAQPLQHEDANSMSIRRELKRACIRLDEWENQRRQVKRKSGGGGAGVDDLASKASIIEGIETMNSNNNISKRFVGVGSTEADPRLPMCSCHSSTYERSAGCRGLGRFIPPVSQRG